MLKFDWLFCSNNKLFDKRDIASHVFIFATCDQIHEQIIFEKVDCNICSSLVFEEILEVLDCIGVLFCKSAF